MVKPVFLLENPALQIDWNLKSCACFFMVFLDLSRSSAALNDVLNNIDIMTSFWNELSN